MSDEKSVMKMVGDYVRTINDDADDDLMDTQSAKQKPKPHASQAPPAKSASAAPAKAGKASQKAMDEDDDPPQEDELES